MGGDDDFDYNAWVDAATTNATSRVIYRRPKGPSHIRDGRAAIRSVKARGHEARDNMNSHPRGGEYTREGIEQMQPWAAGYDGEGIAEEQGRRGHGRRQTREQGQQGATPRRRRRTTDPEAEPFDDRRMQSPPDADRRALYLAGSQRKRAAGEEALGVDVEQDEAGRSHRRRGRHTAIGPATKEHAGGSSSARTPRLPDRASMSEDARGTTRGFLREGFYGFGGGWAPVSGEADVGVPVRRPREISGRDLSNNEDDRRSSYASYSSSSSLYSTGARGRTRRSASHRSHMRQDNSRRGEGEDSDGTDTEVEETRIT